MASTSPPFVSTAHFIGRKVGTTNGPRSPPSCVKFRPLRISAACTSTSERTRPHHITSPASSLYEVLGIQMGATTQEIKTAYRRLARVLHPDVATNGQNDNTAAYEFMRIHEAYATLSDPEKRADYDRMFFRQRQPVSFPFAMSASASASGFSGYTKRTWETDQCW